MQVLLIPGGHKQRLKLCKDVVMLSNRIQTKRNNIFKAQLSLNSMRNYDVIGVTGNNRGLMQTVLYPIAKAILPRLTTCVFSKAENSGRLYDPPGI